METIEKITEIYNFTDEDISNLFSLKELIKNSADDFTLELYKFISNFDNYSKFLSDEEIRKRHKEKLKLWFLELFNGKYDEDYLRKVKKIGEVHAQIGLPSHYVSATMSFIRSYLNGFILENIDLAHRQEELKTSINKILDINLDIMTSSYINENQFYIAKTKIETNIVRLSLKISYFFDVGLVSLLVLTSLLIFFLFLSDIFKFLLNSSSSFENTVINILGAMLILWTVRELLEEEVKRLKGKKFALNVFISLAMAALLRKILIFSLEPQKSEEVAILGLLVLVLGIVYWLMNLSEQKKAVN
ncbi:MAG: protoglobin domain-containing protein [Desulfurella sp.]|uniref:protoglobin domain-containing protein n=1 Tax=Desulfurella sp. TaxID=1962857 RepID=UPI003CBD7ABF